MHSLSVKQSLDGLLAGVVFDKKLFNAIQVHNFDFLTKNSEHRNLFGGQLIGCYRVKYTLYDQQSFLSIFNLETEQVRHAISKITTINKSFKILTDPVNLLCFYTAHRFLSSPTLKKEDKLKYAAEIFNFFSYRTLVVIISNYFIYPTSEQEATALLERLSYKYVIKNVRNWKEYCAYRSSEYLQSKHALLITEFTDDQALPNAINDLYNRTKDTIKNIYREFLILKEQQDTVAHRKSILIDLEGKEVIPDKLNTADSHYDYLLTTLTSKDLFIRPEVVQAATSIVKNADEKTLIEFLECLYEYTHKGKSNFEEVISIINRQTLFIINYLNNNSIIFNKNLLDTLNKITGIVLYSRSTDKTLNDLKDDVDKLIKDVYLSIKRSVFPNRKIPDTRNSFFIYIYIRMFLKG